MFILLLTFPFWWIIAIILTFRHNKTTKTIKNREFENLLSEYEHEILKQKADKKETLSRELDAIQYQLKLLEKLDDFRAGDLSSEASVKKALALEEKYNRLYTKERKLKKEIAELEAMG